MSLADFASSTIYGIVTNVIVVVSDSNITSESSITPPSLVGSSYKNFTSLGTSLTSEPNKAELASTSVTHGFSQGKIIAVMTMLIVFSIFGCLGNGLVLYVFSKKSDKVTSTIFILALAWTDFFSCLIFMPFTVAYIQLHSRLYLDFFCKLYQFLNTSNVPLSAFIMVAIAVDRYFSICHPFMHVVTPRRARVAIVSLVLVAFTLGSITACIYGVHKPANVTHVNTTASGNVCYNDTLNSSFPVSEKSLSGILTQAPVSGSVTESSQTFTDKVVKTVMKNSSFLNVDTHLTETLTVSTATHPEAVSCAQENVEGLCVMNELIFSTRFTELYQKIYISFYIISLVAVFTLYFFIYRSVAERRAWRRKQKSWSHSPMTLTAAVSTVDNGNKFSDIYTGEGENLELSPQSISIETSLSETKETPPGGTLDSSAETTTIPAKTTSVKDNYSHENGVDSSMLTSSAEKKANREHRDFNFLANIRTAIMLFVVTLVFILSFLPAWLMATQLIPYEITIFYMHCLYNVANPVIYAFMNQSFRKELKRVFQRGTRFFKRE